MTTIITTGDPAPEPPAIPVPVDTGPSPLEIAEHVEEVVQEEIEEVRDDVASVVEAIGERLLNVEEVLAYVIDNVDDIVDYLEKQHAEREAINPAAEPDNPVPEKASKKVRERDKEPQPRHKGRQLFLGRSGGIYP